MAGGLCGAGEAVSSVWGCPGCLCSGAALCPRSLQAALVPGQANSQQGGTAGRGLGAPTVLPKPQGAQPGSRAGDAPAGARALGRKGPWVCVRSPCQASPAPQRLCLTIRVTLKGAAFLWTAAGCGRGRVLRSRVRAGRGCAGLAQRARPAWEPPAVPGVCPLPRWCFSCCQSSCAQWMGCKFTVLYGKSVAQASRQRAYWGYFQSNKISKTITVKGSTTADALAPTRLLPWVKQCHCLESKAVINHR